MEDEDRVNLGEDYESSSYYEQLQYLADLLRARSLQDRSDQSSESEEEESKSPEKVSSLHSENSKSTKMTGTEFEAEIGKNLSVDNNRKKQGNLVGSANIVRLISEGNLFGRFEESVKRRILSNFLPSNPSRIAQYSHKVFCGRYCGEGGERFMTASQDCRIRIYNTLRGNFTCQQSIVVRQHLA